MSISAIHWGGKAHDVTAIVATITATLSVHAVGDWLQVTVLFLTIIFIVLGIVMRIKKLHSGESGEGE